MNKQIIRCITCAILCVVLVMLAGCSDESKAKKAEGSSGAQQAYASEASSAGKIFVCSSLEGWLPEEIEECAAVIWVEPVTQEVFLVYPGTGYNGAWREVVGPLKVAHDDTHFIDTDVYPISFDAYKKEAEEQGYTFVYEE